MMHFYNSELAYLLFLIPALIVFDLIIRAKKKRDLSLFASATVITRLTDRISPLKRGLRRGLIYGGVLFLILALMRPQWGQRLISMERKGIDIIFVFDVSKSMLTEDITPNRLEKAKIQLRSFLDKLQGDRVGLVVFAGSAFVSCPLTLDYGALEQFIDTISPAMVSRQGTLLGNAMAVARECFDTAETKYKAMVLLTDGEDHDSESSVEASECAREGIKVYCVGIGTPAGMPIPLKDESGRASSFLKDDSGNLVVSRLDESTLQKISLTTGGKYYFSQYGDLELEKIYEHIQGLGKKSLGSERIRQYEDRYQIFLLFTLILVIVEFFLNDRKSKLGERILSGLEDAK
jgi:Ca-activated chloride channel homolog